MMSARFIGTPPTILRSTGRRAHGTVRRVAAAPPVGSPQAVTFASDTLLDCSSFGLGASVNTLSLLAWVQSDLLPEVDLLVQDVTGDNNILFKIASSQITIQGIVGGGAGAFQFNGTDTYDFTSWVPILASFDWSNFAAVGGAIYVLDALANGGPPSGLGSGGSLDGNGGEWHFGANQGGAGSAVNLSTFWMAPISLLDGTGLAISSTNRRMFTTAANKWSSPSGFPGGGIILFDGNHTSYATNQGTGGAFTTEGTALVDAPSAPPS